jgi:hypothetical protein
VPPKTRSSTRGNRQEASGHTASAQPKARSSTRGNRQEASLDVTRSTPPDGALKKAAPRPWYTTNEAEKKLRNRATRLVMGCVTTAVAAGLLLRKRGPPNSLVWATFALSGVILIHLATHLYWGWKPKKQAEYLRSSGAQSKSELNEVQADDKAGRIENARTLRDAARLSVSTQGVVLGLLALSREGLSMTLRVGAFALAAGVLAGVLLYTLVGYEADPDKRWLSNLLYNLTFFALAYGLFCIVFGLPGLRARGAIP